MIKANPSLVHRSNMPKEQFLKIAAKKKPKWQALIDNVDNLSIEDIDQLKEPVWVRTALKKMKDIKTDIDTELRVLANTKIGLANLDNTIYETRRWLGTETTLQGINGTFELSTPQLFLVISQSLILYDNVRLKMTTNQYAKFINATVSESAMTELEYRNKIRDALNGKTPESLQPVATVGHGGNKLINTPSGASIRITTSTLKGLK